MCLFRGYQNVLPPKNAADTNANELNTMYMKRNSVAMGEKIPARRPSRYNF